MLFFDTSALVKRYAEEEGTDVVDELIEASDESVVITSPTRSRPMPIAPCGWGFLSSLTDCQQW